MMRSLYSGVAGLRTHQTKMDVLGNNIANVNTTSFKSQSITFSDLMYQTTQNASGATATKGGVNARQIGLGAKSGAIATAIESQGATQTTNNPFDIMITGKAFFVVNNGKENLYTRDGSFYVDGAGNLAMQSNGYLVQGWVAQEDKETGEIKINKNGGLSSLQIMSADNSTYSPAATTAGLYSGNIDDNDTNVISDDGKTVTMEFYDNKGYLYTGKFTLKNTGEDHLFSLQLTDIIDSEGNSIDKTLEDGSKLLDHITFGNVHDTDPNNTVEEYTVTVNTTSNVATVSLAANVTKYSSVPLSGSVKDLMSTAYSNKAYAGVLKEAYNMSDTDVTSSEFSNYLSDATYTIDSGSGLLSIKWAESTKFSKTQSYTYSTNVTNNYYFDANTGLGYRVPETKTSAKKSELSTYDIATFQNVFKNGTASPTIDDNHLYTFNGSGSTLTVSKIFETVSVNTDKTATTVANLKKDADVFPAGLSTLLNGLNDTDKIYYTYDGKTLNVYSNVVSVTYPEQTNFAQLPSSSGETYTVTATGTYNSMTGLNAELTAAGVSATDIANITSAGAGYDYYRIETDTSGTFGIIFYNQATSEAPSTTAAFTGDVIADTYTADTTTYPVTSSSTFSGKWSNATAGHDYLIQSTQTQVSDYKPQFLKTVFGMTDAQITAFATSSVSFTSSNIVISTDKSKDLEASQTGATLYPSYDEDNKTMSYKTITAQVVNTIPSGSMEGKIADLLETSEGPYAGLLKTVYGITDQDARAYGGDGTYEINNDGTITLTTGTKTIQLLFDPANGSLVSANGDTINKLPNDGLVNIMFDQDIEGLEPFGYQLQQGDDPEQAGHLTIDFSTVTNYNTSGSSTIKATKGDKKSLNTGRMVGEMNGVTVSTDGQIYATYSNGQTKLLGQIASAEFANASGLSKEGDNLYSSTLNSGDPTIQDITTDGGYMNTGVLEMSNVDLSKEFTEMITTQRGFQANSRIITVSDTLLEELTNLKR